MEDRLAGERRTFTTAGETRRLAEAVREACLRTALDAYEQAGIAGLCAEGRWEMAVDSVRSLNIDAVLPDTADADRAARPTHRSGWGPPLAPTSQHTASPASEASAQNEGGAQ